jgi:hypothetical protein
MVEHASGRYSPGKLFVTAGHAIAGALAAMNGSGILLPQPREESLITFVGADLFHGVERVAQFFVRPRLVDEVLTRMAGRHDLAAALRFRHHVMTTRLHDASTEQALRDFERHTRVNGASSISG